MFTGIITHATSVIAKSTTKDGLTLTFAKPSNWKDLQLGESIATDGVCLTVAKIQSGSYDCQLVPETLQKTTFGSKVPERVNLERSLSVNDRFGGHFVQGHVDGVGTVEKIERHDGYYLHISFDADKKDLVILKGAITINGVSLTIASDNDTAFSVALVPHTLEHTTLGSLKRGDKVNLEFDMIGKYIVNKRDNHAAR